MQRIAVQKNYGQLVPYLKLHIYIYIYYFLNRPDIFENLTEI